MLLDLRLGDLIEVQYKLPLQNSGGADTRWVVGQIVMCEADAWPLARLSDGQMTEIRNYMSWRLLSNADLDRSLAPLLD